MVIRVLKGGGARSGLRGSITGNRWFQAGFGIVLAIMLPALLVAAIWGRDMVNTHGVRNSATTAFVALVAGLLWYRRLVSHPGVQGLENVLSAFIATFAGAAATLLLSRVDYSTVYLLASFLLTIGGFALIEARQSLVEHPHFHVVPFGSFHRLLKAPRATWTVMGTPDLPGRDAAGLAVDLRADMPDAWQAMLAEAVLAGIPVFHIKQLEEALSGRVDIEHMSENQFGSLLPSLSYRRVKALFDIAVAILLLPILGIPLLITALLIKLDTPGPALYKQWRIGAGGRPFQVYKLRSMKFVRESDNERLAAMTQSQDDRITRVGRVIRRYRIDELAQIVNVLRGEMSWIGPRPEAKPLAEWYQAELPFYQYRHIVRPGITGWAQVNQGHVTSLDAVHDKLRYDFYYIKYFSIWLDLLIAIRTIRTLLDGFGAK